LLTEKRAKVIGTLAHVVNFTRTTRHRKAHAPPQRAPSLVVAPPPSACVDISHFRRHGSLLPNVESAFARAPRERQKARLQRATPHSTHVNVARCTARAYLSSFNSQRCADIAEHRARRRPRHQRSVRRC